MSKKDYDPFAFFRNFEVDYKKIEQKVKEEKKKTINLRKSNERNIRNNIKKRK